ncbi:MAG TPA: ATP-binding protein [Candidatus Binataceae bacterium]|nr:ATP-binding protein [Candidatus Binataceae bacterium]
MAGQDRSEFWREIVDSLAGAVIAASPDLDVLAINPAAETLLGVSQIKKPVLGRLFRRNPWLATMVEKCLISGQSVNFPETALHLGHREAFVRAEISPLITASGETEGAVILLQDLSYQQGAEPGFRSDPDALGLSSAGLAHEVKNPLTGIKGAAELLTTMFPADARAQQYCGLILDGVARIAALVEQVLAVSGPLRLRTESVNIHRVLHQALRMAGAYPEPPPGIAIEQMFDPSLPEVSGDAAALERVFLNLIRNSLEAIASVADSDPVDSSSNSATKGAREHEPVKSRKLRLKTALEPQLRMNAHGRRRQFLRVEISDTGKGLTSEEFQQLFTPFFTSKAGGTGLGLVLSKRIVAQHGWKLWAQIGGMGQESPSDDQSLRGMTFCVTLPIGPE